MKLQAFKRSILTFPTRFMRWLGEKCISIFDPWLRPDIAEVVFSIVYHTIALELARDEFVELAPINGTCGPFKLSGNGTPVISYVVFDGNLDDRASLVGRVMEFIQVRVEISKPDRIEYKAFIESKNTVDNARHGEEVLCKGKYKKPFEVLSRHLWRYFPLYVHPEKRNQARFIV
jgi:hypothetical protein